MSNPRLIPVPPCKEDILFREDLPDCENNACLSHHQGGWEYSEGYRRAARLLVEHVVENDSDQDVLLYPIVFLYRHYIELALEDLVSRAPYAIGRSLSDVETKHVSETHRLDVLWQDLRQMLPYLSEVGGWAELSGEDIEAIDSYIHQLTELDSHSYAFRYAHSRKGTQSLPKNVVRINLCHFSDLVGRLINYLAVLSGL